MNATKRGSFQPEEDPQAGREREKYDEPIASREYILSMLLDAAGPLDIEALAERLNLQNDPSSNEALRRRVGAMIRDGQLVRNRRGGLLPVDTSKLIAGRISAHPDGFGFVVCDEVQDDIFLSPRQMRLVLHGDRVVVSITGKDHRGRREGRIVEVVERVNTSVVGRVSIDHGTVVVLPENRRIHQDILIAPDDDIPVHDGDIVVAQITAQPTRRHQPVGKVTEVLGAHMRPGLEIDVALRSHGIPVQWPDQVMQEADRLPAIVDAQEAGKRRDFRDLPLVTIDGADARDFDDAVWCTREQDGWHLLVAIADVAHYVLPDSALDHEAVNRATSVYFPGRVVPMLPEVLSNGLCSLNPDVDRLCMVCEMRLDSEGTPVKARFLNGVMRSHARLTYDQVGDWLADPSRRTRGINATIASSLRAMHDLYRVLADKRRQRGAIEFDSTETRIVFDDQKKIREIVPVRRNDAHRLIEEFMILANVQAARLLSGRELPTLYRVHASPKADKLDDLRTFLALRGLVLHGGDQPSPTDYAELARASKDLPDSGIIQTMMLRSMQQAVYQPANEGHFGLALEHYAHFTSPIRRYPDLLVHRAIKHAIARGRKKPFAYTASHMQALGESCSMAERRAEEATRDVISWLKCEYMQERVGAEFDGVVSAVTSFGLFVELSDLHIEGLIHITNLERDYYRFDQAAVALIGERSGRQYHLGDTLRVQVASVNLDERKIDFLEVRRITPGKSPRRTRGKGGADRQSGRAMTGVEQKRSARTMPGPESKADRKRRKREKKQQRNADIEHASLVMENRNQDISAPAPGGRVSKQSRKKTSMLSKNRRAENLDSKRRKKSSGKKQSAKKQSVKKRSTKKLSARKKSKK